VAYINKSIIIYGKAQAADYDDETPEFKKKKNTSAPVLPIIKTHRIYKIKLVKLHIQKHT